MAIHLPASGTDHEEISGKMNIQRLRLIHFHTFISYSKHDREAAQRLTHLLQQFGIRPWLDTDDGQNDRSPRSSSDPRGQLIPGDDKAIESVLESAMNRSLFLTVISSDHSLASVWMRKEIEIARRYGHPVYFWHLNHPGESRKMSIRRDGPVPATGLWPDNIEIFAEHYKNEPLPDSAHVEFRKELFEKHGLNFLGHKVFPISEVGAVFAELNSLIELAEYIVHKGHPVNSGSIEQFWPEYDQLCQSAESLQDRIEERFGRKIQVDRVPMSMVFRLKRPFVLTRIRHLERLLNNPSFRKKEFKKFAATN